MNHDMQIVGYAVAMAAAVAAVGVLIWRVRELLLSLHNRFLSACGSDLCFLPESQPNPRPAVNLPTAEAPGLVMANLCPGCEGTPVFPNNPCNVCGIKAPAGAALDGDRGFIPFSHGDREHIDELMREVEEHNGMRVPDQPPLGICADLPVPHAKDSHDACDMLAPNGTTSLEDLQADFHKAIGLCGEAHLMSVFCGEDAAHEGQHRFKGEIVFGWSPAQAKKCTCPPSMWCGSEINDSSCALTEEEHEQLNSRSAPSTVSLPPLYLGNHEHQFRCPTDEQQCDNECKASHVCVVCSKLRRDCPEFELTPLEIRERQLASARCCIGDLKALVRDSAGITYKHRMRLLEEERRTAADEASCRTLGQHTTCCVCSVDKHTPVRSDELGGYICAGCLEKAYLREKELRESAEERNPDPTPALPEWTEVELARLVKRLTTEASTFAGITYEQGIAYANGLLNHGVQIRYPDELPPPTESDKEK